MWEVRKEEERLGEAGRLREGTHPEANSIERDEMDVAGIGTGP